MLEIIYQDADCIAVNKPAGMLVHRSWLDSHETQFVVQTLRDQIGQRVYPVHRLDKPTSGVLLFGLSSAAARQLTIQFEQREVIKTYWAVVRGYLYIDRCAQGTIDYPLRQVLDKIADSPAIKQQTENDLTASVQSAVTDWQCLATTEQPFQARTRYATTRYSWASLTPKTGRKHQLRRHMKHVFHPIIGDTSYGDHHQNRAIREHLGIHRLMLHARSLQFTPLHCSSPITVTTQVDNDWQRMMQQFGWSQSLTLD